jgi:hypothetical protein
MTINEAFYIERQGKKYVLYAGLLEEAHERDLYSIDTILLQVPHESNGQVAIVRALVTMDSGLNPEDRRKFTGIGDASPDNVGRNIAPHIIRMAETRAKARALRDAINIGVTAYEEMGGDDEATRPVSQVPQRSSQAPQSGNGGPTPKQASYLKQLIEEKGSLEVFVGKYGEVEDLSRQEASSWIERLKE